MIEFIDDMFMRGSVPYDEVGSIREDHHGFGIIRCKSGEVILTRVEYLTLFVRYQNAVLDDMEMLMGESDEGEDV